MMRHTTYGKTGKKVSIVGFGGMRFNPKLPNEENAELVRYACSKGINYFDTAPDYGESEDIFGIAFKDMPGDYLVSTKASPITCATADITRAAVMKSLDRMGVPKIHFFHVWCLRKMEHFKLAMKPGGMHDGLLKCREEGLIEHIVFSSHQSGSEIKQILDSGKFAGVLLSVNILNFPYRWEGVQAAADSGYGVVAMNPLCGGAIPQHEKDLLFLARDNETPTEAALRFIVSCSQITIALVGFTSREQVDFACKVADKAKPFSDADLDEIRKRLGENMNAVCTGCNYCAGCPQNISVSAYMQYYNEKVMFGRSGEEMKKGIIFQLGQKDEAGNCIECGKCEEACTQHLDIMARLKETAEWERTLQITGTI